MCLFEFKLHFEFKFSNADKRGSMELILASALGVAAVYRMTLDITSPDIEGPFNLYTLIRTHIESRGYPAWVKDGIYCRYCVSFWFGLMFALPLPIEGLISWWLWPIWAVGLSGPATWYYDYMGVLFPDSEE